MNIDKSPKFYFDRQIESHLKKAAKSFPALVVTGSRQSGKSTLLRHTFPNYSYLNLDDPQLHLLAQQDPRLLLESYPKPLIIDEIQYAPNLLRYVKIMIDENRQSYGQFFFTGSQMFPLMAGLSESLAGRVALFELYPFSTVEIVQKTNFDYYDENNLIEAVLKGFYPEHYSNPNLEREAWFSSYIRTYIERDIRNIQNVSDLGLFQLFVQLLAVRAGSLLNLSEIAKECGISVPTAKRWLSLLESTYIVFVLHPFFQNKPKRYIKTPKLYFVDSGLLCYLLGINSPDRFMRASERGRIFENFVIMDLVKRRMSPTSASDYSFYRTPNGVEVDLIMEEGMNIQALEIKFSKTPTLKMASGLKSFYKEKGFSGGYVANLFNQTMPLGERLSAMHWFDVLNILTGSTVCPK